MPTWRLAQMKASVTGKENNEVVKVRAHGARVPPGPHHCPFGSVPGCVHGTVSQPCH